MANMPVSIQSLGVKSVSLKQQSECVRENSTNLFLFRCCSLWGIDEGLSPLLAVHKEVAETALPFRICATGKQSSNDIYDSSFEQAKHLWKKPRQVLQKKPPARPTFWVCGFSVPQLLWRPPPLLRRLQRGDTGKGSPRLMEQPHP